MQTEKTRDDVDTVVPHPHVVKMKLGELYRRTRLLRRLLKVATDAHCKAESAVINAR